VGLAGEGLWRDAIFAGGPIEDVAMKRGVFVGRCTRVGADGEGREPRTGRKMPRRLSKRPLEKVAGGIIWRRRGREGRR